MFHDKGILYCAYVTLLDGQECKVYYEGKGNKEEIEVSEATEENYITSVRIRTIRRQDVRN